MGKVKCVVSGCFRYWGGKLTTNVSFFKLPSDPGTRKLWLDAVPEMGNRRQVSGKVCSDHFRETDMRVHNGMKRLKKSAVPSIFKPWPNVIKETDPLAGNMKDGDFLPLVAFSNEPSKPPIFVYPEEDTGTSADMSSLQASMAGDLDESSKNSNENLLLPTSDSEVPTVTRPIFVYPEEDTGTSADMSPLQASMVGDLDESSKNSNENLLLPTSDSEVPPVTHPAFKRKTLSWAMQESESDMQADILQKVRILRKCILKKDATIKSLRNKLYRSKKIKF